MISVVTPCVTLPTLRPSASRFETEWLITSMKPGATTSPEASTTSAPSGASPPGALIRAILSPSISRSAWRAGAPVPSIRVPPLIKD